MNERYTELAEQAWEYVQGCGRYDKTWTTLFNEKFAELIVRECVDVLINVLPSIVPESKDGIHPAWHIKDHFGFDE